MLTVTHGNQRKGWFQRKEENERGKTELKVWKKEQ